jgi:integrase/recombinase XerD
MATMSPLRQRMIEDLTIRNLAPATRESYVNAVAKFSRYFGRSPDRLGADEVRAYQVHLTSQRVAWSSLNQTVCALRFFYEVTLKRRDVVELIAYARTPRRLPVVLSLDEVVCFLEAVPGLKNRVALLAADAAGLRLGEVVALRVADIASQAHGHPHCRQGRRRALCHAVGAIAEYLAPLLAHHPSAGLSVSGSHR